MELGKIIRLPLKRKVLKFELEDAEGKVNEVVVNELTGLERDTYLSLVTSKTIFVDGKPQGMRDLKGLRSALLSACLTINAIAVTSATIDAWPTTTVEALFDAAQELSGLSEGAQKKGNA